MEAADIAGESVTVVIPCFNEEEVTTGLRLALADLESSLGLEYDLRFLFVDDGSTDNTVRNLRREFANSDEAMQSEWSFAMIGRGRQRRRVEFAEPTHV